MKLYGLIGIALLILLSALSCSTKDKAMHYNIRATVFWVGEDATPDNSQQDNYASSWDSYWTQHFGGVDDPKNRQRDGLWPATFTPQENPFYFALPYTEFTDAGATKQNVAQVPWYDPKNPPIPGKFSIIKNRWIQVVYGKGVAYAQWEDTGPYESDDTAYVFGHASPQSRLAGLDLSPATAAYLKLEGSGQTSWKFVDESAVPPGPWREIITTRQISY
jgi:hypothetical protein